MRGRKEAPLLASGCASVGWVGFGRVQIGHRVVVGGGGGGSVRLGSARVGDSAVAVVGGGADGGGSFGEI